MKPHLHLTTFGASRHGKTTLRAALAARTGYRNGIKDVPNYSHLSRVELSRASSLDGVIVPHVVDCETVGRIYHIRDGLTFRHACEQVLSTRDSAPDAAILVVACDEGPTEETRHQLRIARLVGISQVVVFLSKTDRGNDPELLEVVEWEVRELLCACEYPGDDVPIIHGDARTAYRTGGRDAIAARCLDELLITLDTFLATPVPESENPFLLWVEDVFLIKGRGLVATGRIDRGKCHIGDTVEIVGLTPAARQTTITGLEMFGKPLDTGLAGDALGIFMRELHPLDVQRGQVLASPGSIRAHAKFEAFAYFLHTAEGGRRTPFFSGYRPQVYFRTTDVSGTIALPPGVERVLPGEEIRISVTLLPDSMLALEPRLPFIIREGGRTIGVGIVTRIPE